MHGVNESRGRKNKWVCFFLKVGHYHFVGAYAATVGAYAGTSCREVCLHGLRECGFVLKMPTRLQSGQPF